MARGGDSNTPLTPGPVAPGAVSAPGPTATPRPDRRRRASDLLLLEAFESAPAAIAVTMTREHAIAYLNPAYVQAFGKRAMDVPGREAFPELIDQGFFDLMDHVFDSGEPFRIQEEGPVQYVIPGEEDTRDHWFTFSYSPIRDTSGRVQGILTTAVDVTSAVLARRAAEEVAVKQRNIARELQGHLLPRVESWPQDVEVASRYAPGVAGTDVGGDWYDVIGLGAGRTALVIGDVMGRGVNAAAVMGQLSSAVRALARMDLPPDAILQNLDALIAELGDDQIATCVYAIHDPVDATLTWANAGHPPPILAMPGQPPQVLNGPTSPPLGTQSEQMAPRMVDLPPEAMIALYTDGLVEQAGIDIDDGIVALTSALASGPADLERLADQVLGRDWLSATGGTSTDQAGNNHAAPDQRDDVALLLVRPGVRFTGSRRTPEAKKFGLPAAPEAVSRARAYATGALSSWDLDPTAHDDAILLVSELTTNAIRHASGPIELRLRRTEDHLVIEVADGTSVLPRLYRAGPDDEGGRGLMLVAALSQRWGSRPTAQGKGVWCLLDVTS